MTSNYKIKKRFNTTKGRKKFGARELSFFIMFIFLFVGVALGSFAATKMGEEEYESITGTINSAIGSFKPGDKPKADMFKESMFKNGKIILLVWILGFLTAGSIVSLFIIGFKGFGVGYMVSIFIMEFGGKGVLISSGLFLLQNMALIALCFFMAQLYMRDMSSGILRMLGFSYPSKVYIGFTERFLTLLISAVGVLIISLYEAYVCPWICLLLF